MVNLDQQNFGDRCFRQAFIKSWLGSWDPTYMKSPLPCYLCRSLLSIVGVKSIKVSLADEKADIQYDLSAVTPEQLRDAIDDMGFDANLLGKSLFLTL